MTDIIMGICSWIFAILFFFLAFIFIVFIVSLFKKDSEARFTPCITIVIPAHNEEKNIKGTIESVLNSDYPTENIEIILVDDGSTDRTISIAEEFKQVKVLRQQHKGKSEALNTGVKKSRHNFIVTIDADTSLDRRCLRRLTGPLADKSIGATTGTSRVKNTDSILASFQNIEYHYNNLIRKSFSAVFNNSIWFFGAMACYRKDVLEKIGYFKKDTLTEDMDVALEIYKAGYRTFHSHNALCYTVVPETLRELYHQRSRWWMGTLQALNKNKLFNRKSGISVIFLYINQYWWSLYAVFSLPVIIYQVNYWLPTNSTDFFSVFSYLFRWFSLSGPIYVLYKIPEWGLNFYNFFGVFSGIISSLLILASIKQFQDSYSPKNMAALFFYFPYTIVLNIIILLSLLSYSFTKKRYFIR